MSLERPDRVEPELLTRRTVVVTALPLKRAAQARLAELLDARVVDVRHEVDRADLVLTPACSPQLIGLLKQQYPGARIVVVELDDWDFDISLSGPVKRILRSGADAYVLADSVEELVRQIAPRRDAVNEATESPPARELPSGATVDDLVGAFLRESLEHSARRGATGRHGR